MPTEYGSRLRKARKHAKLTQQGLGKITGIAQSTISTAEREGNGSADTPVYAKACGVDVNWLATGKGEMLPTIDQWTQLAIDRILSIAPEDRKGAVLAIDDYIERLANVTQPKSVANGWNK